MKRILATVLALVLVLTLAACGKSEAAKAADELIGAVGTVTLDSEEAICAAEEAVGALTDKEKKQLENTAVLEEARAAYDALVAEAEAKRIEGLKQKAAEVDALIDAIGTVTMDSDAAVTKARAAYDAGDDELRSYVTKVDVLKAAEDTLGTMKAEVVIKLIDAIGNVTLKSGDKIQEAQDAFDALSAADQARVTNAATLKNAKAALKEMRLEDARKKLSRLTVDEDFVRNISFYYAKGFPYYHQYGYWGADVRCFVLPYIGVSGDSAWLRMVCNYTADDWVFFKNITFAVDEQRFYKSFDYFDVERDNDWNDVWEYVDIAVGASEIDLLTAIANSTKTVVRFEGDTHYRDFTVSAADKQAIREMLEIYEAFK